jgi:hypothetical protein
MLLIERLEGAYENLRLIHLPIHVSWLNQVLATIAGREPTLRLAA